MESLRPLFWCVIAGAPGALVYRTANTLDSMVGHRTDAYEKFGKASARIDDFLNWVPARICAIFLCFFHSASSLESDLSGSRLPRESKRRLE